MAFKCHMRWYLFLLVGNLFISPSLSNTFRFDFKTDLEQWASNRGKWHWSNHGNLGYTLPVSYDGGFAVMDAKFDSDELYTPKFSVPNGALFTIKFYLRSEYEGSNTLTVSIRDDTGNTTVFLELSDYSFTNTKEWFTISKDIPPSDKQISMNIFCYNGNQAALGQPLRGCAIDHIVFETYGDPSQLPTTATTPSEVSTTSSHTTESQPTATPITEVPVTETPTTEASTSNAPSTEVPTTKAPATEASTTGSPMTEAPTTEAPDITTAAPDITTEAPNTNLPTTENPATEPLTTIQTSAPSVVTTIESTADPTTEAPDTTPPTTDEPATEPPTTVQTAAPSVVTTIGSTFDPTDVTTEAPQTHYIYDFQSSTNGWSLSLMNGAYWKREVFDYDGKPCGPPPNGPWALEVVPALVQTGQVMAQSPQLEVTDDRVKVTVTFWLDGTNEFPARLMLRRRFDFSAFDPNPVLDLSSYGDQQNYQWTKYSGYVSNPKAGEQFSLTLEGSLGAHPNNSVVVHRIEVEGVKEVSADPSDFFNFERGLFGWTPGSMNGGRWHLMKWENIDQSHNIPQPPNGAYFLMVERYNIFSGIISLESPRLELPPGYIRKLQVKFWIRGSVTYPAALRFRVKGNEGKYDEVPFLNLEHYGDTDNPQWIQYEKTYSIPTEDTVNYFQLVIEADLGGDMSNLVAVDDLRIISEKV